MFLKIVVALVALIVVFLGIAALQKPDFRYTRTAVISAPAPVVFAQVNDFHRWQAWSPWARMDPTAKNSFEGPGEGVGAGFAWDGNSKVGAGHMAIVESKPSELVRLKIDFERPFKGTNMADFAFKPVGDKTEVTWSMTGQKNLVAKAMGLVIDCDKMIGSQFEEGLANLNTVAQAAAK